MKGPTALLEVGQDGVAVITLKNAPVNALHPQVLEAFFDHLRQAQAAPQVKAIVVRGAGGVFCAGFDIAQFAKPTSGNFSVEVNKAFVQLLEDGPKPVVAAIEKTALGGGCELALACHGRICAPGCQLGLPELTLGILPGFGGTQRLPRAVGLQKALEMILTSKPIKCKEARKLGLVDDIVAAEGLLEAAKKLALDMAAGRKPFMRTLYRTDKLESLADALQVLQLAEAETKRRAKDLQHPLMALEAVRHGVMYGGLSGIQKEAEVFEAARSLDAHKALVHIFFAQRQTKKVSGVTDGGLKPRPMRRVAVLGGGLMGSGIATALTMAGVEVLLKEVDRRFLDAGLGRIRQNLASRVKKGALSEQAAEQMMARVTGTLEYGGFGSVDMVIEAVIENVALKQRIFADLERHCRPDAILASNTSTISIDVVGNTCRPDTRSRIVGAHFFSPAHVMPLLEVVRSQSTSKQVVLDTLSLGVAIKKTPVVVGNCTGFAVNRVFFPYTMAACMLADAGVDPLAVDRAIAGVFQMPMGPFRLTDLVGADIGLHVAANFVDSFPDRVYRSKLILLLNEAKMLGEKTGKGFYSYDSKRRASANPAVKPMVEQSQRAAGLLAAAGGKPLVMSPQDIIEFVFFPVVNEGCRVVAEGIVDKPADLDVASVMAMGFPAFRGGIIFWGDLVGAARIVERLESWATMFPAHAGFFRPCEYLKTAAQQGRKLGAGVVGSPRM